MTKFTNVIKEDTPRLVVNFKVDDIGKEQYEWGIHGNIPLLSVIGAIVKVEVELASLEIMRLGILDKFCNDRMLLIAFVDNTFHWFLHKDTPKYGMLGMLEMIRATLIDTTRARQA